MGIANLEVIESIINREVIPFNKSRKLMPHGEQLGHRIEELALGKTTAQLFVRGPAGKLYILDAPVELVEEIQLSQKTEEHHGHQ